MTWTVRLEKAGGPCAIVTISIPGSEAAVIRDFQERMPYRLFAPDVL
jgi:hypothetical protein